MATGCAPAELLGGGRDFFDALVEQVNEERQNGWFIEEQLATLIEVEWAQLRVLMALAGVKHPPAQINLPRPNGGPKPPRVSILDVQKRLAG